MATEMGEFLVGAYLRLELKCGVVDYNARSPGGGLQGLGELDVIGFDFDAGAAYLCEVTTHLEGLLIGRGALATFDKIVKKHERQKSYAAEHLRRFRRIRYMFWSPVVARGLAARLGQLDGLELMINGSYKTAIDKLRKHARRSTSTTSNPAFRVLQILEHLRS